jgi:hypothetical protein
MGDAIESEGHAAKIEHILIDYENAEKLIEAGELRWVEGSSVRVTVFCGPTQKKIRKELAFMMQSLGAKGTYVDVKTPGKNALDFHLAYWLGRFVSGEPDACYYVIAEDEDYDPLIKYMKEDGVKVWRLSSVGQIFSVKKRKRFKFAEFLKEAIAHLEKFPSEKWPRTHEALHNSLKCKFSEWTEEDISGVIESLFKESVVTSVGTRLEYRLPPN